MQETATSNNVSAMPTFVLFKSKVEIDRLRGADEKALEDKIKKWYDGGDEETEAVVKGHVSIMLKVKCYILCK